MNETNLIALKHSDKFAGDVARFVGLGKPNNFMIIICVGAWKDDYNFSTELKWILLFMIRWYLMFVIP